MKRIGLIAGNLDLPVIWARAAKDEGYEIICIAVTEGTRVDTLHSFCRKVYSYPPGELDSVIKTLKGEGITQSVMVGKVPKETIFAKGTFDERAKTLLSNLPDLSNDLILEALVKELEGEGIIIMEQTSFIKNLVPQRGVLAGEVDGPLLEDMEFGFRIAKALGGLDIGQTVVVKDLTVVAAEALEGTDATIRRGGTLVEGGVVAKVAKPHQDMRFDIPIVGLDTLRAMGDSKMRALVLEEGRCAILDKGEFLLRAQELGFTVYAMEGDP